MNQTEQLERVRQAIMRYRELLDLLHQHIDEAEQTYQGWFKGLPADEIEGRSEKDRQSAAARRFVDDPKAIRVAAGNMRFICREFEREFEELHDHLVEDAE